MYSCSNTDKLPLPIQMQLIAKLETFSMVFIAILESALNFERLKRKRCPHRSSISEVFDSERRFYLQA